MGYNGAYREIYERESTRVPYFPGRDTTITLRCDNCGKVVAGYDRDKFIGQTYLHVRGGISVSYYDTVFDRRRYTYATEGEYDKHNFCSGACLEQWARAGANFKLHQKIPQAPQDLTQLT